MLVRIGLYFYVIQNQFNELEEARHFDRKSAGAELTVRVFGRGPAVTGESFLT